MTRSASFGNLYLNSYVSISGPNEPYNSIAEMILQRNNIPYVGIGGSPLIGYDIKSQDSMTILKLSLLASSAEDLGFPEVYCRGDGIATKVNTGEQKAYLTDDIDLSYCFLETITSNYKSKIDHVLVKASDPLPTRYSKGPIDITGGGIALYSNFTCQTGIPNKAEAYGHDAWVEFSRSLNSPETQQRLKAAIRRSQWEELVGYRVQIASVPKHANIALSETVPRTISFTVTNLFDTEIQLSLGDPNALDGNIVDISNVVLTGAPILDIIKGSSILKQIPDPELARDIEPDNYLVLLDHLCGLISLSKGQHWFLLPGAGENTAIIMMRRGGASKESLEAFNELSPINTKTFRRTKDSGITSILGMLQLNKQTTGEYLPALGGSANSNPPRGRLIPGFSDKGVEVSKAELCYSISKSSIQVKSHHRDAPAIASSLTGGIQYTPIATRDAPAATGYASNNGFKAVYPPSPADNEGEKYRVDSEIDELEGTVIDMSAPWTGPETATKLASKIFQFINMDTGFYKSRSYGFGGYNLLPGMILNTDPLETIHTIEYEYSDRQSISTNITTGPKYYPIGSWSDSKYVRRSESFTKTGKVIAGSNSIGAFLVNVDGLGAYTAINTLIDSIYPGDRVEVRLLNVPVEI